MIRALPIVVALMILACAGEPDPPSAEPAVANPFVGDWVQSVPSGDALPNVLTCRITESGLFRLVFQHGPARPFGDHRGRWTLLADGRLGVRFTSEGTSPDTITVRLENGSLVVPFPLRELESLVFPQRR